MPRRPVGSNPVAQIESYLKSKGSPLAPYAKTFVGAGKKYGVDPFLVVAISGIESSFGKHNLGAHNAWGWGPGKPFSSWDEGITHVTQGIKQGYYSRGLRTPEQIVGRYAPSSDGNNEGHWAETVTQFLKEMGATNVPALTGQTAGQRTAPSLTQDPSGMPSFTPPKTVPVKSVQGIRGAAMKNLAAIAQGKLDPATQLANLAEGQAFDKEAEAQARAWGGTTIANDPSSLPTPRQGGNAAQTTPRAGGKIARAIEIAKKQIGKPYKFGAAGPSTFDCSGLIEWSLEQAGIKTPGRLTTGSMIKMGRSVKGTPMQPGDWLVRHDGQQQHVVMYVGNGQVIAAPHTGEVVQYQDADNFTGAGWDVRRWP